MLRGCAQSLYVTREELRSLKFYLANQEVKLQSILERQSFVQLGWRDFVIV